MKPYPSVFKQPAFLSALVALVFGAYCATGSLMLLGLALLRGRIRHA